MSLFLCGYLSGCCSVLALAWSQLRSEIEADASPESRQESLALRGAA